MNWSIIFLLVFLAGCSNESVPVSDTITKTEPQDEQVLAKKSYSPMQARKFSKGEALYINNCADCHGWEGRGKGQAARLMGVNTPVLLNYELLAKKTEEEFVDWVLSGKAIKLKLADEAAPQTDSDETALLAYIKNLPNLDWNRIESGHKVYDQLCVNCHGLYGRGDGVLASQMPDSLSDLSISDYQLQHDDNELRQIISKGKEAMPGAEDVLDAKEVEEVIAYVRHFSPSYESYDRFCAVCHGVNGSPMQMVSLSEVEGDGVGEEGMEFESIDIPNLDDAYFKTHTDQQITSKIKHMWESEAITMPHFEEQLSRDQVREIFRYLSGLIEEYP